ncbi:NADP-dependent oxidoreductase [Changpingibacter yushuensis]|uniref:NADP-dependent oxidoreductase n=1 Tax=Changpingibacter yushuensis TaxID=2758440 RepID=UPI0015F5BB83|nr:NADP-dependent oxidoreductase [Changpingibacter yushuensis]
MKAQQYSTYGDTSVLEFVDDHPMPKVGPGRALVRVKAAAVNPVDWKVMAGGLDPFFDTIFPIVPGWDVAGVVEAVGAGVSGFAAGDEVMAYARDTYLHNGTFAEFVPVSVPALARKPGSLSWEEAGAMPLAGLMAYQSLRSLGVTDRGGNGKKILIHNANGGVGAFATQLAHHFGWSVIGTASPQNHDRIHQFGAIPVAYGDGLAERILAIAPAGVDVVLDLVGGVLETTLKVLKAGGSHGSIADSTPAQHGGKYLWVSPSGEDLTYLAGLAEHSIIQVPIAEVFPLNRLPEAFELSASHHAQGKIVVVP